MSFRLLKYAVHDRTDAGKAAGKVLRIGKQVDRPLIGRRISRCKGRGNRSTITDRSVRNGSIPICVFRPRGKFSRGRREQQIEVHRLTIGSGLRSQRRYFWVALPSMLGALGQRGARERSEQRRVGNFFSNRGQLRDWILTANSFLRGQGLRRQELRTKRQRDKKQKGRAVRIPEIESPHRTTSLGYSHGLCHGKGSGSMMDQAYSLAHLATDLRFELSRKRCLSYGKRPECPGIFKGEREVSTGFTGLLIDFQGCLMRSGSSARGTVTCSPEARCLSAKAPAFTSFSPTMRI